MLYGKGPPGRARTPARWPSSAWVEGGDAWSVRAAEPREGGGREDRRVAGASTTPALRAALRGGGRFPPGESTRPAPGAPACEAVKGLCRRRAQTLALRKRVCVKIETLGREKKPTFCLTGFSPRCCCKRGSGKAFWERRGTRRLPRTFTDIQSCFFPSETACPFVTDTEKGGLSQPLPQVQCADWKLKASEKVVWIKPLPSTRYYRQHMMLFRIPVAKIHSSLRAGTRDSGPRGEGFLNQNGGAGPMLHRSVN